MNLCVFGMNVAPNNSDKDSFIDFCATIISIPRIELEAGIVSAERTGREITGKIRPLVLKLSTEDLKHKILRSVKLMKDYNDSIKPCSPVIIAPDLTRRQQEANFKLRDELRARKDNNENVRIQNGRIVNVCNTTAAPPRSGTRINRNQQPVV